MIQLHIVRQGRLGAKGAREPQRRKDRSGGNPARRRVSADLHRCGFSYRSHIDLSASTHGPSRLRRNATESSPVDKTNHAGRAPSTNPTTNSLRTLRARPALPFCREAKCPPKPWRRRTDTANPQCAKHVRLHSHASRPSRASRDAEPGPRRDEAPARDNSGSRVSLRSPGNVKYYFPFASHAGAASDEVLDMRLKACGAHRDVDDRSADRIGNWNRRQ